MTWSSARCRACAACRRSSASAAWSAKSWSRSIRIACSRSGLTAVDVSRRLRGTNVDLAGGRAEIGGRDQAIRTLAGARTLNDLAGTMISLPTGGAVRLDDLGIVTDTIADRRTFARFNGEPVVALRRQALQGRERRGGCGRGEKADRRAQEKPIRTSICKLIDTSVDFTRGQLRCGHPYAVRRRGAWPSSSCCCSCAICGRR